MPRQRAAMHPQNELSGARRPSSRSFENDLSPKAERLVSIARSQSPRERGVIGMPISSRSFKFTQQLGRAFMPVLRAGKLESLLQSDDGVTFGFHLPNQFHRFGKSGLG